MTNPSNLLTDRLREAILGGRLRPGEPLRQDALAEQHRVSRTPVRQALHQLAGEGLVSYDPNRGARVATITAAQVRDLFDMRHALEPMALASALPQHDKLTWAEAEMALDRADAADGDAVALGRTNADFHRALYRPSGRTMLLETVERLTDRGVRAEIVVLSIRSRAAVSAREHRALLVACIHDHDEALRLLREHLTSARDDALAAILA